MARLTEQEGPSGTGETVDSCACIDLTVRLQVLTIVIVKRKFLRQNRDLIRSASQSPQVSYRC